MANGFEPVHVFAEWDHGPRCGLANYQGQPHLYQSLYVDADEPIEDHFALVPVREEDFYALLDRLRGLWPDPEPPMFFPADLRTREQDAAFSAAWGDLQERVLTTADRAVRAAGEMRPRSVSGRPPLPEGEEGPLEVAWSVRSPGWVSGVELRQRLAELERRRATQAPLGTDLEMGEDIPF